MCCLHQGLTHGKLYKKHPAFFFGENSQSVFLRATLSLHARFDSQLFCFGLLRAWRSPRMSHALKRSCFSPWYLHLVPFGAIMCYMSLSAGRSPKVCGEWYWSWETSWNEAFMVHNCLVAVSEQASPMQFSQHDGGYTPSVSVIRVEESWECDGFSSHQAVSCY